MKYFSSEFVRFFNDLEKNNRTDWFHENKKRYETHVKKPFETFIANLIAEIQKHDPDLNVAAKDCILRINRDVRFSADKTPYNLHYTAFVSNGGRKNKNIPGIFLRFSPKEIGIMGGCYAPDKTELEMIRRHIARNPVAFQRLYLDKNFVSTFKTIEGEQHKRLPAEFQELVAKEPIVANKQFYFIARENPKLMVSDELLSVVMKYWHTARPLNDFLSTAINHVHHD